MKITNRAGDNSPYYINRYIFYFGIKCIAGIGSFSHLGGFEQNFSVCHGFGNPDAFLVTFTSYYPFYFVIG